MPQTQPRRKPRVLCQTGGHVSTSDADLVSFAKRGGRAPTSDANLASCAKTQRSHFNSKREGRASPWAPLFNYNANSAFQLQHEIRVPRGIRISTVTDNHKVVSYTHFPPLNEGLIRINEGI